MNKSLLYILIFCGFYLPLAAQNTDKPIKDSIVIAWDYNDSYTIRTRKEIDTSNSQFHNYSPNAKLSDYVINNGSFASPSLQLFYSPLSSKPFYLHAFENSLFTVNNMLQYTAKQPFTALFYSVAKNQEQQVSLLHTQNYNKDLNVGLVLNFYQSLGEFEPQSISGKHIAPWITYSGRNFSTYFKFAHNSIEYDENGGILNDSLLNKMFISTTLSSAKTVIKYQDALYIQKWKLIENDDYIDSASIDLPSYPLALGYRIDYSKASKVYNDANVKLVNYDQVLFDSTSTVDSSMQKELKNTFFIERNIKNKNTNQVFQLGVGYDYANNVYRDYNLSYPQTFDNSIFYTGNYSVQSCKSKFQLDHSHTYYFQGNYTNDISINTGIQKTFNLSNSKYIELSVSQKFDTYKPHAMYADFMSNHYVWNKVNENEIRQQYKAEMYSQLGKIKASVDFYNVKNYMFFSSIGQMEQSDLASKAIVVKATKQSDLGVLSLQNGILWQSYRSNGNEFPAWATYNSIAIHDIIYKKLVDFRIGLEALYYPKYFTPQYNKVLAAYTVQHTYETGAYPHVNGFLSIKYKPIRILVKYTGLYAQFVERNFIVPHYPQQSGYITFAVSWLFYN